MTTNRPTNSRKGKVPDLSIPPPPLQRAVPYRACAEDCRELDLGAARIITVMWWDGGLLTDFVFTLDGDLDGEWGPILRIDCCHDEVHIHRFDSSGGESVRKVLRKIESADDIRMGYDEGEREIFDHWEENVRRWGGGR